MLLAFVSRALGPCLAMDKLKCPALVAVWMTASCKKAAATGVARISDKMPQMVIAS